jgi:hypothetical protein
VQVDEEMYFQEEVMKAKDFFDLVSEMREAQKLYFKTRSKEVLQRSKILERKVDDEIVRVNNLIKGSGT